MRSLFIFLLLFSMYPPLTAQSNPHEWELSQQTAGIEVYTRPSTRSPVKEVRIKTTFDSDLDRFMQILEDAERYQDWVYKCATSRRLKTENDSAFYYYVVTDMPFPVTDRDLVIYSTTKKNTATGGYDTRSVATQSLYPPQDDKVRIPLFESSWHIVPQGEHRVSIDYQVITEAGGSIPYWIINLGITMGPVRTMQALQKMLTD